MGRVRAQTPLSIYRELRGVPRAPWILESTKWCMGRCVHVCS